MDSHIGAEVLGLIYMKVGAVQANVVWLLLLLLPCRQRSGTTKCIAAQ